MSGKYKKDYDFEAWSDLPLEDKAKITAREVDEGLRTIVLSNQGGEPFSIGFLDDVELELITDSDTVIIPDRASLEVYAADLNCKNNEIVNLVLGHMAPLGDEPKNVSTDQSNNDAETKTITLYSAEVVEKAKVIAQELEAGSKKAVRHDLPIGYRVDFLDAASVESRLSAKGFVESLGNKGTFEYYGDDPECINGDEVMAVARYLPLTYECS